MTDNGLGIAEGGDFCTKMAYTYIDVILRYSLKILNTVIQPNSFMHFCCL